MLFDGLIKFGILINLGFYENNNRCIGNLGKKRREIIFRLKPPAVFENDLNSIAHSFAPSHS